VRRDRHGPTEPVGVNLTSRLLCFTWRELGSPLFGVNPALAVETLGSPVLGVNPASAVETEIAVTRGQMHFMSLFFFFRVHLGVHNIEFWDAAGGSLF